MGEKRRAGIQSNSTRYKGSLQLPTRLKPRSVLLAPAVLFWGLHTTKAAHTQRTSDQSVPGPDRPRPGSQRPKHRYGRLAGIIYDLSAQAALTCVLEPPQAKQRTEEWPAVTTVSGSLHAPRAFANHSREKETRSRALQEVVVSLLVYARFTQAAEGSLTHIGW
jgi:hypothetical protein